MQINHKPGIDLEELAPLEQKKQEATLINWLVRVKWISIIESDGSVTCTTFENNQHKFCWSIQKTKVMRPGLAFWLLFALYGSRLIKSPFQKYTRISSYILSNWFNTVKNEWCFAAPMSAGGADWFLHSPVCATGTMSCRQGHSKSLQCCTATLPCDHRPRSPLRIQSLSLFSYSR